jgi:hypothetical protein
VIIGEHTAAVCSIRFSNEGDFILSAGADGIVSKDGGIFCQFNSRPLVDYIRAGYFLEKDINATDGNYALFSDEFTNTEFKSYVHMSTLYSNDKDRKNDELESKLNKLKSKTKQDELIKEFQSKDEIKNFKGIPISEIVHLLNVFDGNEFLLYLYLHKIAVFYEEMPKTI